MARIEAFRSPKVPLVGVHLVRATRTAAPALATRHSGASLAERLVTRTGVSADSRPLYRARR